MKNLTTIKPGQRITLAYSAECTWRAITGNPFVDMEVTREMRVAFTACGRDTYSRMMERHGQEKSGKRPWFEWDTQAACLVRHAKTGAAYVPGINHDTLSCRFLIGGKPASETETAEIQQWLKPSSDRARGVDFKVWSAAHLINATVGDA